MTATITNPTPQQTLSEWPNALRRLDDDQAAALALIVEALEEPANGWHWSADGLDCDHGADPYLEAWPHGALDPDAIITITVDDDGLIRIWEGYAYDCNDSHTVSPAHVGAINGLNAAWNRYYPTPDDLSDIDADV